MSNEKSQVDEDDRFCQDAGVNENVKEVTDRLFSDSPAICHLSLAQTKVISTLGTLREKKARLYI